jgi:FtsZ-binding cell division protein ZapB
MSAFQESMKETKSEWEPAGLERFAHLEDKIYRVVEAFKTIRKDSDALRAENGRLRAELEGLRQSESARAESVASLQKEREQLRERVERALTLLASLEIPSK